MKYALTTQQGGTFASIDTYIIEDGLAEGEVPEVSWRDGGEELVDILRYFGNTKEQAEYIVGNHLYYIVNCDDIDLCMSDELVYFNTGKEYMSWQNYRQEVYGKSRDKKTTSK